MHREDRVWKGNLVILKSLYIQYVHLVMHTFYFEDIHIIKVYTLRVCEYVIFVSAKILETTQMGELYDWNMNRHC